MRTAVLMMGLWDRSLNTSGEEIWALASVRTTSVASRWREREERVSGSMTSGEREGAIRISAIKKRERMAEREYVLREGR
jgi:hypothetical protein